MSYPTKPQNAVIITRFGRSNSSGDNRSALAPITVVGYLPEDFEYSVTANYEQPYADLANDLVGSLPVIGGVTKTHKILSPFLTANYWQGSETGDFTLTIYFEADSDPITEIRQPILSLLSLVTPQYAYGMMTAPIESPKFTDREISTMIEYASAVTKSAAKAAAAAPSLGSAAKASVNEASSPDGLAGIVSSVLGGVQTAGKKFCAGMAKLASEITGDSTSSTAERILDSDESLVSNSRAINKDSSSLDDSIKAMENNITSGMISPTEQMTARLSSNVRIKIGTYIEFPSVIITNVSSKILSQLDAYTGWPMSASVDISFRPMFSQTIGDIQKIFLSDQRPYVTDEYLASLNNPVNTSVTNKLTSGLLNNIKSATSSMQDSICNGIKNNFPSF